MGFSADNPKTALLYPLSGSNGAHPPSPPAYARSPRDDTTSLGEILVFIAVLGLWFLLLLVDVIITVAFGPRVSEFAVSSACVTGFNLSSVDQEPQLSAFFDLNLTVHSPNRLRRIYYEQVTARVLYASDILSETPLAPFNQGKGETTVVRVQLATVGRYVNSYVAKGIESDRGRGDGAVGFDVRVVSWVQFGFGPRSTAWPSPLSVHCDGVLIGFGNGTNAATTGYLLGSAPKKCVVISDIE